LEEGEEGESSIVGSPSRALPSVEDDKSLMEDCQSAGGKGWLAWSSLKVRFRGEAEPHSKAALQIFWFKTCHLGEAGQHARTDLVAIMKSEDDIGPPSPL
jgi:hypothetical protein